MIANIPIQRNKRSAEQHVFSILIPSWNNLAYLQLCIESIRKNSSFRHQLIVHVNEGSDGTLEWIKGQQDIDYTFSKDNIGICYALNISASLANTPYILYMNDDMYACPKWDAELLSEIKAIGHINFFLSATMIEPLSSNNPSVIVRNYGTDISHFEEERLLKEFASLAMNDWQGATWPPNVVHKDTWDLVGGYSAEFSPGMGSDPDFSMKLWNMGIRLYKGVNKSRVYHFGCKSTARVSRNNGSAAFLKKYGISSSTLTRYYLKRGTPFDGPLPDVTLSPGLKIKNFFKRLSSLFRG